MTSKQLCDWYTIFNFRYFRGSLPRVGVVWRKPFVKGHAAEYVVFKDGTQLIVVNPVLKKIGADNYVLQSILHEMCHVKVRTHPKKSVREGHGHLFQREMKRLANLGAFRGIW